MHHTIISIQEKVKGLPVITPNQPLESPIPSPQPNSVPTPKKTTKLQLMKGVLIITALISISLILFVLPKTQKKEKTITITHAALGSAIGFYEEYNQIFTQKWKDKTGESIIINNIYDVSGELTRNSISGKITAEIFTLSNPTEVEKLAQFGLVDKNWQNSFPHQSSPFYSVVTFIVRRGNPKKIIDWGDLIKPNTSIITSDPINCGGGRWVYTAALNYSQKINSKDYISKFYQNVKDYYPNQAIGGTQFIDNKIGDVLITYESYALAQINKGNSQVEIVTPPESVAINIPVVLNSQTTSPATIEYINGLYSKESQLLAAKYFFRPRDGDANKKFLEVFPKLNIVNIDKPLLDSEIITK